MHNATLASRRAIPNGLTWSNERSLLHGYPSAGRRKSPDLWNREHFSKAFKYRKGAHSAAAKPLAPTTMLLLWGRVGASGELVLEPAFVVNAPPVLPQTSGPYWLIGKDADGSELFALSFDMAASADGDGGAAFAFALPVQPEWADELERITLSGPKRAVTMDGDGPRSVAILQDSSTGRVLGILRDLRPEGAFAGRTEGVAGIGSCHRKPRHPHPKLVDRSLARRGSDALSSIAIGRILR